MSALYKKQHLMNQDQTTTIICAELFTSHKPFCEKLQTQEMKDIINQSKISITMCQMLGIGNKQVRLTWLSFSMLK